VLQAGAVVAMQTIKGMYKGCREQRRVAGNTRCQSVYIHLQSSGQMDVLEQPVIMDLLSSSRLIPGSVGKWSIEGLPSVVGECAVQCSAHFALHYLLKMA
jgi:hypothetical protein